MQASLQKLRNSRKDDTGKLLLQSIIIPSLGLLNNKVVVGLNRINEFTSQNTKNLRNIPRPWRVSLPEKVIKSQEELNTILSVDNSSQHSFTVLFNLW